MYKRGDWLSQWAWSLPQDCGDEGGIPNGDASGEIQDHDLSHRTLRGEDFTHIFS